MPRESGYQRVKLRQRQGAGGIENGVRLCFSSYCATTASKPLATNRLSKIARKTNEQPKAHK